MLRDIGDEYLEPATVRSTRGVALNKWMLKGSNRGPHRRASLDNVGRCTDTFHTGYPAQGGELGIAD